VTDTQAESHQGKRIRAAEATLLLAALALSLYGLRTVYLNETVTSRLATVWSLVHDGTWYLDRPPTQPPNPFEQQTIDKAEINGRILSTKPPLLPLLMTGEYMLLHRLFAWELGLDKRDDLKSILRCMTFSLAGLSYLLALFIFARLLGLFVPAPRHRLVLLFALAFATQLPGFAAQLNNHVPAAAMQITALYFALGLGSGKLAPVKWRFFLFGLAAALVFTLDMPMTVFAALAGLYLFARFPRQALLWGGLGAAGPLIVHFAIMLAITGSPLPVQVNGRAFLFEGSYWRIPTGVDALNEPKPLYLFHMTFGRHGAFALFPILLIGLAGFAYAVLRREMPWRSYVLGGGAGLAALTFYYVMATNNYGGEAYGFRWYIGAMPVLLLMGAPVLDRLQTRWKWAVLALLLAVSMYSAWECYQSPWGGQQEWTTRLIFGPAY